MILVIANYRTGSTTLCKELCEQYGYTMSEKSGELFHGHKTLDYSELFEQHVIKVMPDHIMHCMDTFKQFYLAAERVIYCVRKDFCAQLLSYCAAQKTHQWHPSYIEASQSIRDNSAVNFNNELRTVHYNKLFKNLELQSKMFKLYPGELIYLEQRPQVRYPTRRYINVPNDVRMLVDVESYFE